MIHKVTRRVRLYGKYRPAKRSCIGNDGRQVPWLNVSGLWLEQAGFMIGDQVEITVESNQLIIKNKASHGDRSY